MNLPVGCVTIVLLVVIAVVIVHYFLGFDWGYAIAGVLLLTAVMFSLMYAMTKGRK